MIGKKETEQIIRQYRDKRSDRDNWDNLWQEIAKYFLPAQAVFHSQLTPGQKYDTDVYNSVGIQANSVFASGIMSYLFNSGSIWFGLESTDKDLADDIRIKQFFDECSEIMFKVISSSNFYTEVFSLIKDLVFGTGVLYEAEDEVDIINFQARPLSGCCIAVDHKNKVNTMYEDLPYNCHQAFEAFGRDKAGKKANELYKNKDFTTKIEYIHVVMPRWQRDSSKIDDMNMEYASYYIELSNCECVQESGYHEFPYFVPRLERRPGEDYGRSMPMTVLADFKSLNTMTSTMLIGGHKAVDPIVIIPHDGGINPFRQTPGSVMTYNGSSTRNRLIETLPVGNLPYGREIMTDYETRIKEVFFNDLFLMLSNPIPGRTAYEIAQMVEQKTQNLSPIMSRLMYDLLDSLVIRTFNLCHRRGMFPEFPEEIQGKDYNIVYISPLARAQKYHESRSIENFMALVASLSEMFPDIADNINADKVLRASAKNLNINTNLLHNDEEVGTIRAIRQQQIQQEQEMQGLLGEVEALKKASEAERNMANVG